MHSKKNLFSWGYFSKTTKAIKIYNHTIRYRKNQFKFFKEIFNQFSVIPTTTDHGWKIDI
jgi:hypothetical protein